MKTTTSCTIDTELLKKANEKGLNKSKVLNDALKMALDSELVLIEKINERKECLNHLNCLEAEINALKEDLKNRETNDMEMEQKFEDAISNLVNIFSRIGTVTEDQINFQASINNLNSDELAYHWNNWIKENMEVV